MARAKEVPKDLSRIKEQETEAAAVQAANVV
jgi:hypothetical protein